jgi:phage terminase Nu1 subunit (DNA packaging protein)
LLFSLKKRSDVSAVVDRLIDADLDNRLLFNQKTTALLIGISTQAFSKWGIEAAERRGREAFYYWPEVLAERDRRRFPEQPEGDEEFLDLDQQRARHAKEQADKLALENAAQRSELIFTTHMADVLGRALAAVRARLLSSSSKLAPRVNPGNPNLARDLIEREHADVLAELADFDPGPELGERQTNGAGAVRHTEASAQVNGKRVGRRRAKAQ